MNPLAEQQVLWCEAGKGIKTRGTLPENLQVFEDHFPGFPVLPGVLAIEILNQAALSYCRETGCGQETVRKISAVKFQNYLRPGDRWESSLEIASNEGGIYWKAKLFSNDKPAVVCRFLMQ